jgi:hypothetical protein
VTHCPVRSLTQQGQLGHPLSSSIVSLYDEEGGQTRPGGKAGQGLFGQITGTGSTHSPVCRLTQQGQFVQPVCGLVVEINDEFAGHF